MISINNLSFSYKKRNPIFSNIDLELKTGNIYGLLGENGVGKTTLLRLISGLLFPTSGEATVNGENSSKRSPKLLADIYYLPEDFSVPAMKVENFAAIYGVFYPNYSRELFLALLNKFNVTPEKKLTELSQGQRKKAMISFALACNTSILLMDEPTNGLDIPSKSTFRRLIAENINENKTFVISTHQVRDLENLIDPIIILEQKQILVNNSVDEITQKLKFYNNPDFDEQALYSEPVLDGYAMVDFNSDASESKLNIEMLFNAAISNKEVFKNLFIHSKK